MDNQTPRILIVDDDPNMLGTVGDILKLKGFEPVLARTDSDALAQIEEHRIDVALIDLRLGKVSGLDVLRSIKARSPETECILLTGHATQNSAIDAIQLGAFGYFQKPFDMEQVLLSIQRAVEKRITQHALHESEERYRVLTEQIPAIVYLEDATIKNGHTLYISPQVETILGITPEEWMDEEVEVWANHIHPDDRERVTAEYDLECFDKGRPFNCEYRMISSDNRIVWIRDEAKTLLDEHGKPYLIHGIMQDITERKQAEEALRQSEARFHALIQNAADLIMVINTKGVILYTSPSSERILGYLPQECLGRNFIEWVHPEDMHIALVSLASRVKNPGTAQESIEVRGLHKNGTWRVIEVLGTNLLAEPAVQGIVINMRDVTERKYAEEAVHKSEERFRALIEHSADAITLLDADGIVLYESPTAKRILEYQTEERVGLSMFELLNDEDLPSSRELFERVLQHPSLPLDTVFRYWHKDGAFHWAEATFTNLLKEPNVNAIVVNYRDVTERTQTEEALHQSEKRYRGLFEDTPIAIWEEDFSELKKYLDSLKQQGITDFQEYFALNPDVVSECSARIKVLDVNNSAVQMFGAENKEVLIKHTNSGISKGEAEHNHEDFIAIVEGKTSNSWEGFDETLSGEPIEINLSWSVAPGYEDDFSKVIVTTLDITKRRKAEEALRESEKRYHDLFEDSPIALVEEDFSAVKQLLDSLRQEGVSDFHTYLALHPEIVTECAKMVKIKEVNKAALKMYRADSKNKMPKDLTKILRDKAVEHFGSQLADIADGQVEFGWEGINHAIDDSQIDVEVNWSVAAGYEKDLSKVIVSLQDITERRRAEEALRENEVRYRMLFENAPVGILSADVLGNIVEVNPVALQILGSPSAEATKSINLLTFPPLAVAGFSSDFKRCVENRRPVFAEFSYTTKWGKNILAQYHLTPIMGEKEQITQVQIILEDITERRRAEETLRDRETTLQAVLQSTADGILAVNSENKVLYANERFAEMWLIPQSTMNSKDDAVLLQYILDQLVDPQGFLQKVQELYKSDGESLDTLNFKDGRVFERLSRPMLQGTDLRGRVWSFRDITERKQAEEDLRRAEEKYRNIFENSMEGIFQSTPAGRFITVNSALARMWGYDSPEDLVTTVTDIANQVYTSPEVRSEHKRLIKEQGGNLFGFEYQAYRKDGSVIWVLENVRSVHGADGALHYYEGTVEDISTRKQAEEAVRESEEKYRLLVENAGEALYVLQNGLVVFVNPMFEKIAGLPAAELIGTSILDFIPEPKDRFAAIKNHQRLLRGKIENAQWEFKVRLRSGMERWVNVSEVRTTWKGEPATLNYATDITERRRFEEQLLLQSSALNAAANAIFLTDIDGAIKWVNPAFSKLTGYTLMESIDKNPRDLVKSDKQAKAFYKAMWDTILAGQVWYGELVNRRKDKSQYTAELTITPLKNADGRVNHFIAIQQDITERKQAEEHLKRRVEELNAIHQSALSMQNVYLLDELASEIINILEGVLNYKHCAVLLVDENSDRLVPYALSGQNHDPKFADADKAYLRSQGIRVGHGIVGWVAQNGKSVRLGDVSKDERYHQVREAILSEMCVPLMTGNRIIGVVNIESNLPDAYTEADQRVLETIASQITVGIQNARLFEALQRELDERKQSEASILRLNRLYATFSEINQTIVRVRDQHTLFEEICSVSVEYGQFRMAWIGLLEESDKSIKPVNFAGEEQGYLANLRITSNDERFGRGPTGTSIRERRCVICQDIATNPMMAPWRDQALARGYRSSAALPITQQDRVIGALTVYASEPDSFDIEDEKLLNEIGKNISFALNTMQVEAQRKQADEAIHQRVMELELLYESGLAFGQLLNPKEIAKKIINLLEQKMDWHHTAIRLYNPETKTLHLLTFNQPNLINKEEITAAERQLKTKVARLDQGLSGWVVQHGQTVRSNDLTNDNRYIESLPGMQSGLYVPIKLGEHVIGVISIESEISNAFSEADERLTNTLANQAASALENARLFDETRQRIMELTALHQTGQTLLAARLNPEELYAAVHQAVALTMPCDAFVIVLDDEDHGEYHAVYFFDEGERFAPRRLPREKGLSGRVIASGETLLIDDTVETPVQATHFGSKESVRSILAVPLRRGDTVTGMLSTQSYQPHAFGESQKVLLETITAQLSSALENAHLYQQTQARINELETLHIISTSLRTIQTTDEALSVLLDNTLAALETNTGAILLYDPPSNELHDIVARGWYVEFAKAPIKVGDGVVGTVFASGESFFSAEFSRDSFAQEGFPSGWGGACLPIRTSTEIIGVLFVSVHLPRQINLQQMKLLESLVDMAGAALHRMRLHNETARRAEEFASLYETSKVLSAEYDLDSLLRVIVDHTKAMLHASTSGMYLYRADSQELELMMDTSVTVPIGSRLQLGEGVAGKVAETRLPLRIDNYSTWEGRSRQFSNISIGAVIEVPMLYAGELIGVLTADEASESSRKFTEADERLLSLFASQAAGAINSARHHEDTIRHAEELEQRVMERTAEIEATRQRLDLAASAGGIGVWEVNLKDYIVFWDTRMHMIHGTGAADFDNSLDTWWKMLHPEDVKRSQVQFKTALQKTGLFMDEYRILHPDGSVRHIAANAIVLYDGDHKPERMIGVNMDITERKQAEEAMHLANLEMERALRTKDEFLANMSHELRTPLNAILGISESLEEQFVGALNEKQLKYTGIIRESGRHLLELINDILDISKIEAGRMELDFQNLSAEKICQASLRMIKELAQKKELNVSFEIKGDVKAILGDERRLKQSLVNLLGNAVKFTPQGGAVGLEVNGHADTNEVTFTVWDTGVGIAESDIQYLFKPFVQLDSGLSREYQGTGLGLALVAQMIRLHGGRVHVESVLGRGSRFIITLPWMSEQQNARAKMTGELPPLSPKSGRKRRGKILLVEDTSVVITLMSEYLDFKGYKVLIARNGVEGVQLAKQEHPDLILMDVMMPVMDGLEATRQIRTDQSLRSVPIIALTALAMAGDREICLAAGMNDYMSKPIKMQELADIIEKHLGNEEQETKTG